MARASQTYRPAARALHWIVALLVLAMVPAGLVMVQEGLARPVQNTLFVLHKNGGVVVLLLMLIRVIYRASNPPPALPASVSDFQARIAGVVHLGLYAVVLVMAVSGYVRVAAGGFPLEALDALGVPRLVPKSEAVAGAAKQVHYLTHYAVIGLVAVHVAAALYHAVIRRDGVFSRMWPGRRWPGRG